VLRRGKVISRAPAMRANLSLEGRPEEVSFRLDR
jgi:cytosine deaminase